MLGKLGILPDISQYPCQTAYVFASELLAERNHIEEELKQEELRLKQSKSDILKNQQAEEKKRLELRQQFIKGVERGSTRESLPAKFWPETKRSYVSFFDSEYQERMRKDGFRLVINNPVERTLRVAAKLKEPAVNLHSRIWRWNLAFYTNVDGFFKAATAFQDLALNGEGYRYAKMKEEQLLDQSRRHYIPGIANLMSQAWFIKNYTYSNVDNTFSLLAEDKYLGKIHINEPVGFLLVMNQVDQCIIFFFMMKMRFCPLKTYLISIHLLSL